MLSIYVYEKNKESLLFLKDFFLKNKKKYKAEFFIRLADVKKKLNKASSGVLITGAPECLKSILPVPENIRILAMLPKGASKGMRSILEANIEHYMLPPFFDYDLSCKLQILAQRTDYTAAILQEKKDLETIINLTDLLSTTLDPEEVLYLIVKKLSEVIPVSRCSILSVDSGKSKQADVISTFEKKNFNTLSLDLKKYPEIRKALRVKDTVIVNDAGKDPLMKSVKKTISPLEIKSIMVIPVFFRSEVIGTLFLRTTRQSYSFTAREIKLCQNIANTAAKAINNAYLFQEISTQRAELEKLSITDYLTGIYNIRYLYHRLESEFASAKRYQTPLSCILLDIDHFKRINDNYGHRTGDIVLREFAQVIKGHTRKSDVFARYGGEEFILLLPHSNLVGAIAEANRLGEVIRKHKFKGLKKSQKITISLGVASYPYHKKIRSQDDLISLSDDALLKAKSEGRDKVVVYD